MQPTDASATSLSSLSSTAMFVDYVEKNSSDTAIPIPKPLGEIPALPAEADKWPIVGNGAVEKGHLKRPANSAPGSVSPGTGGTNPRRGQSARSRNSTTGSASPASSVINPRTDGDIPSEWLIKKGGKNVSPNSVTDTTTPLRWNKSGYPVIAAVPTTGNRGKKNAIFGAILQSPTTNLFQALATDSSANMDH